ncbi:hypothetical protein [Clostridium sp.]
MDLVISKNIFISANGRLTSKKDLNFIQKSSPLILYFSILLSHWCPILRL